MATLLEGQEYGLVSNEISESKKTLIHFKLTDSALKTLEDFSKINKHLNGQASIQFKGNLGIIRIPSHVTSGGRQQPEHTFQFSLSALPADPNGSFDCIQQTSRHGSGSLESLGSMQHKVTVHATDDVYDRTRAKMTLVEEETKKVCTKEIKPSGRHISKKVQKVLPAGSLKVPNNLKVNPAKSMLGGGPSRQGLSASTSASSLPTVSSMSSRLSAGNVSSSFSSFSQSQNRALASSKPLTNSMSTATSSRVLTSTITKPTSGAINMPYRDRVIHLLALKPYKKPEIILRLQKDGIREKDKNSLGSILQQVATLNKDNSYTLSKAAWIDVRQDWPFYSEEDKILLKKNLQDSRVTPTSPAVSPASSNPESPGSSQKRVLEDPDDQPSNPTKKKRIAHGRQPEERPVSVVKPILTKVTSPTANRENVDGAGEDSNTDSRNDFERLAPIDSVVKRHQYKQEFNKEYDEYRLLHKEVDSVARKFQNLRSQIDQTEEGSRDFEVLKKQVLEEYEAQKSDPKFMEKKQRMEYLHQKLGYIKRLIHEFDHRQQQPCS